MPHFKKLIGDRIYLSPKTTDEEDIIKYTEWMNDFQVTDSKIQKIIILI